MKCLIIQAWHQQHAIISLGRNGASTWYPAPSRKCILELLKREERYPEKNIHHADSRQDGTDCIQTQDKKQTEIEKRLNRK